MRYRPALSGGSGRNWKIRIHDANRRISLYCIKMHFIKELFSLIRVPRQQTPICRCCLQESKVLLPDSEVLVLTKYALRIAAGFFRSPVYDFLRLHTRRWTLILVDRNILIFLIKTSFCIFSLKRLIIRLATWYKIILN